MISTDVLVAFATLLVFVSALIPSVAAAFMLFPRGQRRSFFVAALVASVAMIVVYELAVIKFSSSIHSQGKIAVAFIVIGPVLVSTLSAVLVSRHFNRR